MTVRQAGLVGEGAGRGDSQRNFVIDVVRPGVRGIKSTLLPGGGTEGDGFCAALPHHGQPGRSVCAPLIRVRFRLGEVVPEGGEIGIIQLELDTVAIALPGQGTGELHALLIEPSGEFGVILAHNLKEGVGHHRLADVLRFHGTVQNQRHRSGFSSIAAPGKQAVSKPAHFACVVINPVRTFRSSAGGKAQHRVGGGNELLIGELLLPPGQRHSGLRGGGTVLSSTGLRFAYAFRAALRFLFRETGALAGGVLRFLRRGGRFCGTARQQTECQHQGQESFHPIASFQSLF